MEVVGWGRKEGPSYEGGGEGVGNFMMIYWGGGQNFSISHHEKCITDLPLHLQFQISFFSTKRHSEK